MKIENIKRILLFIPKKPNYKNFKLYYSNTIHIDIFGKTNKNQKLMQSDTFLYTTLGTPFQQTHNHLKSNT
jgi:hypothetical protein